jgi:hypothetical protein
MVSQMLPSFNRKMGSRSIIFGTGLRLGRMKLTQAGRGDERKVWFIA